MDYKTAKDIRSKSFGTLLAEQEGGAATSFKKALSQKTQAKMTGLKETFDPMNIAKKMTFGSNFAPAMIGKLFGAKQENINYFTGAKKKDKIKPLVDGEGVGDMSTPSDVLGLIYRLMMRMEEEKKIDSERELNYKKEEQKEEDDFNEELIRAITGRKKTRTQKKAEKRKEKKAEKKETPKEAPKIKAEKVTTKAPTKNLPTGKIIGGAAILGTAGLVGKEALAVNISKYESGKAGYDAYNKGTVGNKMIPSDKPIDFSKMTITEYLRRGSLKKDDPDRLFAVGRYQIIPDTMKDLVKQMRIDPDKTYLDATTQDSLFANGLVGTRRKKVDDYVKGRSNDRDGAILQLAQEFASVGIPYDMKVGNKQLRKGDSYYSGQGGNKAHNPPEDVGAALDADRQKNMKTDSRSDAVLPQQISTGSQIDQSSKENKSLKEDLTKQKITNTQIDSTSQTTTQSPQASAAPVDDSSAYSKKVRR